jgi:hypothetical protein
VGHFRLAAHDREWSCKPGAGPTCLLPGWLSGKQIVWATRCRQDVAPRPLVRFRNVTATLLVGELAFSRLSAEEAHPVHHSGG